jgi:hypothetical protein
VVGEVLCNEKNLGGAVMRIILKNLASPYRYRRKVIIAWETLGREEEYDVGYLTYVGSAIQSVRDTTAWKSIYHLLDGEEVVVETLKYRVYFKNDPVCLSLSEDLASNWVYNFLARFIGPTAALGAVAVLYKEVVKVERIAERKEVSSEESEVA